MASELSAQTLKVRAARSAPQTIATQANYINNRKMIFYLEYGIHARNQAIKQMREIEANEEMALKNYEYLSNYTQQSLNAFLRENEESTNLAGHIAEEKVKTALQLSQQVHNLTLETSSLKTEISNLDENLEEYKAYKKFLDGLARDMVSASSADCNHSAPGLAFKEPSQLLNIFAETEEQNVSLARHAQVNEEALEEVEKKIQETRKVTEEKVRHFRDKITEMEGQMTETGGKISTLKLLIDMFTGGYYDVKSQENMMKLLRTHVDKVYKSAVGDNDAHLDSVLMLTSVEKKFEELVRELGNMPPEVVTKISRDLEKERRENERLEKERERKALNDMRFARNLERTTGPTTVKKGRNLAFRSRPPKLAISLTQKELDTKAEEEEWNYYFGE